MVRRTAGRHQYSDRELSTRTLPSWASTLSLTNHAHCTIGSDSPHTHTHKFGLANRKMEGVEAQRGERERDRETERERVRESERDREGYRERE